MNADELTRKYIDAMEETLLRIRRAKGQITVSESCLDEVFEYVTSYLKDAKYFREQKKFETSLTSIAYCEGLLDALRLIGAIKILSSKER